MELSIVSLGTVPEGGTATDAYDNTIELAQRAEELGYSRFWVAEHHGGGDSTASTTPEVLIAHLAAKTSDIRLGSGTVLLNHYSPYKVAETFSALDALAPGRIDMGLGRASGQPAADHALQYNQNQQQDDHADKIEEAVKHLYNGFPDDHPYSQLQLARSGEAVPQTWVLGSSPNSAAIAGRLGLPYCFAAFIRPDVAPQAFEAYRENFDPAPFAAAPDEPEGMIGVNVSCGDTDEEAARLRASVEAYYQRLERGEVGTPPAVDDAIDELGGVPDPTPHSVEPGDWPQQISGSPATVRDLLEQMTEQVGVDEVVVQNMIPDPDDRVRSYELIADGVGLAAEDS
ncbi:LLM class flavin-dependent oxidoreductase [Halococcus thailandensis]|uniref:Luciferase family oxidoreductase, group 1 n=1 Tax=Halococcus thailandensis JCM 13552 TaxID=1227457 RepID=M0N7W9_9EURY|nr:LLM class flavin-dependent oxidoreductase [Halococcus thailandensis]EMA54012.1 luciferase family oxidoreductase, group 1 [Halococcus thailandensis JCM 13552]